MVGNLLVFIDCAAIAATPVASARLEARSKQFVYPWSPPEILQVVQVLGSGVQCDELGYNIMDS